MSSAALLLLPALPAGLWAAWSDLARMTIPNRAVLALLAGFALLAPFVLDPIEIGARTFQAAVVLAGAVALYAAGLLGAGDAKFGAAAALYVAPGDGAAFILLLTVVVTAAFVLHRGARRLAFVRAATPRWESWGRTEFPLGVALGPALAIHLAIASTGST